MEREETWCAPTVGVHLSHGELQLSSKILERLFVCIA